MNKENWDAYTLLYKKYDKARAEYHTAQMNLHGAFSEMARTYDKDSLNHNRLYEEDLAHTKFQQARDAIHRFIQQEMKND